MFDNFRRFIGRLGFKISSMAGQEYVGMTLREWFNFPDSGAMTDAGIYVTPEIAKRASAVFACIRILGGCVSTSPKQIFKRMADGGREPDIVTPMYRKLHLEPNPMMSAAVFDETFTSHIYLHGNGLALIDRNYGGEVKNIFLLDPRNVKLEQYDSTTGEAIKRLDGYSLNARMRYYVPTIEGGYNTYDQDDILHVPNIFVDVGNGKGTGSVEAGAQAIGLSLVAERRSAAYLKNSPMSDIALEYPNQVKEDLKNEIRKDIRERLTAGNSGTPHIITEGGAIKTLTMDVEKLQLLGAREFQVVDIARIFGLPPWLLAAMEKTTSWGTGIEQMNIGMVTYTLNPLIVRIEQEYNRKIFRNGDRFVEHNMRGLLRGDAKARSEYYKNAIGGNQMPGWMKPNEVRKLENLTPDDDPESDKIYRPPANAGSVNNGQDTSTAA